MLEFCLKNSCIPSLCVRMPSNAQANISTWYMPSTLSHPAYNAGVLLSNCGGKCRGSGSTALKSVRNNPLLQHESYFMAHDSTF